MVIESTDTVVFFDRARFDHYYHHHQTVWYQQLVHVCLFFECVLLHFCLSFLFELKPLIEEIDDHWLTSYVFSRSDFFDNRWCHWNMKDKRGREGRMSGYMILKIISIPADTPQQIFNLLKLQSTFVDSYLDDELLITYRSLSDSSGISPWTILFLFYLHKTMIPIISTVGRMEGCQFFLFYDCAIASANVEWSAMILFFFFFFLLKNDLSSNEEKEIDVKMWTS